MTIKLFDPSAAPLDPFVSREPFADSGAAPDALSFGQQLGDFKPSSERSAVDGTSSKTPAGFESKWDADGAHLPFVITK